MQFIIQVPNHTSTCFEWSDWTRDRQERSQTIILLLCRASARNQSSTRANRTSWEPQLVPDVHQKWHTDANNEIEVVKKKKTWV